MTWSSASLLRFWLANYLLTFSGFLSVFLDVLRRFFRHDIHDTCCGLQVFLEGRAC
jgi:hypothetical protein